MSARLAEALVAIGWPAAVVLLGVGVFVSGQPPQVVSEVERDPIVTSNDASSDPYELALLSLRDVHIADSDPPAYTRSAFGDGWKDPDRNGCDARNDTLKRDLTSVKLKPGTQGCVVLAGTLHDPYTGMVIRFLRGNSTSEFVQIDHIVPLAWAWRNGAWEWTDDERLQFANSAENLLAVDGPTNQSKSDSGPSQWTPPNPAFRCEYSLRWVEIVSNSSLAMPISDVAALEGQLSTCSAPVD